MGTALDILNLWRAFAEATLSGNYTNKYIWLLPEELQDATVLLCKWLAELLF